MANHYQILIADDHSVVRQGVSILLASVLDSKVIFHASTFPEVLLMLHSHNIDLIILDISIPEGKGVLMIELIREIRTEVSILVFSGYDESQYGLRYLIAGANGYLNKLSSDEEFKVAIKSMQENRKYFSDATLAEHQENRQKKNFGNPLHQLSGREMEIAKLLVRGDGNLEIANKLNLQHSTVSTYKNRIFEKLEVSNTVALFEIFNTYNDEFQ